ncbi:MAG: DUF2971 domain-containing protein [Sterolibacterium sp.]|nr:DUF2971 domain-containing protein [Sterolibacterium sp.]
MSTDIFRFLSFESFVDMVLRQELAFVTYDQWQDPYEGFVIRAMQTYEGRADIITWLKTNNETEASPEMCLNILHIFRKTVHLQSWTRCPESDALWRIYAHSGNAIRISTTIKKLQSIDRVQFFPVEYKSMNLERELKRIFVGKDIRLKEIFSCKREAFSHEKEFRILSEIDQTVVPYQTPQRRSTDIKPSDIPGILKQVRDAGQITKEQFAYALANNNFSHNGNVKNVRHISFAHIPNFIDSVMVHPNATNWFVKTVGRYCDVNEIQFLGRSKLYEFHHR